MRPTGLVCSNRLCVWTIERPLPPVADRRGHSSRRPCRSSFELRRPPREAGDGLRPFASCSGPAPHAPDDRDRPGPRNTGL